MLRRARTEDRERVEALLASAGLPTDGVVEHFASFVVAEEAGRVVGTAGLEAYGDDALLRSVVVAEEARGCGLGVKLAEQMIDEARSRGARALYLLTTTAVAFFPRFGFVPVPRDGAPPAVRTSREFTGLCPASATLMRRAL